VYLQKGLLRWFENVEVIMGPVGIIRSTHHWSSVSSTKKLSPYLLEARKCTLAEDRMVGKGDLSSSSTCLMMTSSTCLQHFWWSYFFCAVRKMRPQCLHECYKKGFRPGFLIFGCAYLLSGKGLGPQFRLASRSRCFGIGARRSHSSLCRFSDDRCLYLRWQEPQVKRPLHWRLSGFWLGALLLGIGRIRENESERNKSFCAIN